MDQASDAIAARSPLERIRARISRAEQAAGRAPGSVTLVAVSKTHPVARIEEVLAAGQRCFGENRVQEAAGKFPPLRDRAPDLRLHLIGPLQTNKADLAVRLFDVIETLDRPKLADAIARAAAREGRMPELLVQVNIGVEPQKAGVATHEAERFIADCRTRFGASLTGLMCIPPASGDPLVYFRALATLGRRLGLDKLSMGMSGDFEAAIQAGATAVRVGSALFGERPAELPVPVLASPA